MPSQNASAQPPAPVLISPQNGAFGVAAAPTLHWNDSTGATSFDVYFGTSPSPPFLANTTGTFYGPILLGPNNFYWRIVAKNAAGSASSPVWTFATQGATTSTFSISPTSVNIAAAATTGVVAVTATPPSSTWTAVSNAPWLTITGAAGIGNGTVGFAVAANTTGALRVGTLTIAGQTFAVTQAAPTAGCSFSLNPVIAALPSGSGTTGTPLTGSFTLAASGCGPADTWTAISDSPRLQVISGASGSGATPLTTITYSMFTNSTTLTRLAHILVGGQTFTVTQSPSTEDQLSRVVRALYQTILGREPDLTGFGFWTGPGAPRDFNNAVLINQMADGFYRSPEFASSGWLTLSIYQAVTGSQPIFNQWLSAVTQLRQSTLTAAQLVSQLTAGTNDATFVQTVIQNAWGRPATTGETNAFTAQLASGLSRSDFLNNIVFADPQFQNLTNSQFVTMLYFTILVRDTDQGGLSFWLTMASNSPGHAGIYYVAPPPPADPAYPVKLAIIGQAVPPNPALLGFLGSPEFQGLIQ